MSLDKTQYSPKFIFEYNNLNLKNVAFDKIFKFPQHKTSKSILKDNLDYYPVYYTYVDFYKFAVLEDKIIIDLNKVVNYLNEFLNKITIENCCIWFVAENFAIYYNENLLSASYMLREEKHIFNTNEYLIKKLLE